MDAAMPLHRADRSPAFRVLVRAGFAARALVYGLIGGLALALALHAGGGRATDQQGALDLLAGSAPGSVALAAVCLALLAYAAWKADQAISGRGPEGGGGPSGFARLSNGAGAIAYLAFAGVAARVLLSSGGSSGGSTNRATAGVLGWPGGPVLVVVGGLVLLAVCALQLREVPGARFLEDQRDLRGRERTLACWLGRVGISARSLIFALAAWFLIRAAVEDDPAKAGGLDGALRAVARARSGHVLLAAVAAGLLVFAAYSLLEARHRRL